MGSLTGICICYVELGLLGYATTLEENAMPRVTLDTIARHMGLSKFAVSRALAGKSGVSDETRRRVEVVAADLGYAKPNSSSRSPSVALVVNDVDYINSELQLMIQAGVQAEAKRRGEFRRWGIVALPEHDQ